MSTDTVAQTWRNSMESSVFLLKLYYVCLTSSSQQHLGIRPAPVYLSADKRMRGINMHSNDNPKSSHPFMI